MISEYFDTNTLSDLLLQAEDGYVDIECDSSADPSIIAALVSDYLNDHGYLAEIVIDKPNVLGKVFRKSEVRDDKESISKKKLRNLSRSLAAKHKLVQSQITKAIQKANLSSHIRASYSYDLYGGIIYVSIANLRWSSKAEELLKSLGYSLSGKWEKGVVFKDWYSKQLVSKQYQELVAKYNISEEEDKEGVTLAILKRLSRPVVSATELITQNLKEDILNTNIGKQGKAVYMRDIYGGTVVISVRKPSYEKDAEDLAEYRGLIPQGEWQKDSYGGKGWISRFYVTPEYLELKDEFYVTDKFDEINDSADDLIERLVELGKPVEVVNIRGDYSIDWDGHLVATILRNGDNYVVNSTSFTPELTAAESVVWNKLHDLLPLVSKEKVTDSLEEDWLSGIEFTQSSNFKLQVAYDKEKSEIEVHRFSPKSFTVKFTTSDNLDEIAPSYVSDDTPGYVKSMVGIVVDFPSFQVFYNDLIDYLLKY